MLDVHPPHSPTHTWKDFFIHIATITVGLLIAVGLEQTVEAIHRHRERTELRAALDAESRQILRDTQNVEDGAMLDIAWFRQAQQQLSDAAREGRAPGPFPPHPSPKNPWDVPDNPVYTAAKASGRLTLLDEDEIVAYGELDGLIFHVGGAYIAITEARRATSAAAQNAAFGRAPDANFGSDDRPESLRKMYEVLAVQRGAMTDFRYWSRQSRGAATALVGGERDLHKIEAAERQFDKLPGIPDA